MNARGVDVVGFQEMQRDQFRTFLGATGGGFAVHPGESAGPLGIENSLAWRRSEWTALSLNTIQIPYFDGRLRPMPYVLLQHNLTGRKAWFANFHNPASNSRRGNNDGHRWRAMTLEIELANRLWNETGYPVFITGDMNEREVYFCNMTGRAPMIAANGGSNAGSCNPPGTRCRSTGCSARTSSPSATTPGRTCRGSATTRWSLPKQRSTSPTASTGTDVPVRPGDARR